MGDWSDLLFDLLVLIAKRIDSIEDFVAFGGVCTSWRSAATKENFNQSSPQVPWLMLAEKDESGWREFYSLSKGTIRKVTVPEAEGKMCLESRGWLITISKYFEIKLVHPLPSYSPPIKLPDFVDFDDISTGYFASFIHKGVLSTSPYLATSDCIFMVIHGTYRKLAFWRCGDTSWTTVGFWVSAYQDLTYYNGQFYAIDSLGNVVVCHVDRSNPTTNEARVLMTLPDELVCYKKLYIVESAEKLLIVSRSVTYLQPVEEGSDELTYGTTKFDVLELNLKNSNWVEVKNLGDRALFLGQSSSISIEAPQSKGLPKPNCIYFTDDCEGCYWDFRDLVGESDADEDMITFEDRNTFKLGGTDMGIYNLEDGSFQSHYNGESYHTFATPIWVQPSF